MIDGTTYIRTISDPYHLSLISDFAIEWVVGLIKLFQISSTKYPPDFVNGGLLRVSYKISYIECNWSVTVGPQLLSLQSNKRSQYFANRDGLERNIKILNIMWENLLLQVHRSTYLIHHNVRSHTSIILVFRYSFGNRISITLNSVRTV